jgi:hypothetical protein
MELPGVMQWNPAMGKMLNKIMGKYREYQRSNLLIYCEIESSCRKWFCLMPKMSFDPHI